MSASEMPFGNFYNLVRQPWNARGTESRDGAAGQAGRWDAGTIAVNNSHSLPTYRLIKCIKLAFPMPFVLFSEITLKVITVSPFTCTNSLMKCYDIGIHCCFCLSKRFVSRKEIVFKPRRKNDGVVIPKFNVYVCGIVAPKRKNWLGFCLFLFETWNSRECF